jgi:uncharacterized protein (DUF2147 family)
MFHLSAGESQCRDSAASGCRRSWGGKLSVPFLPQKAAKLITMNMILARIAPAALAFALPAAASAQEALEGQWRNPKGSIVVRVAPCGGSFCGTVVRASEKAKAGARKGGTPNLVGTRILTNLRPVGNNLYRGQAFEPKRKIRAPATVRMVGPNAIEVKGCAIGGMLLCKEQRWTRVS